MNVLQDAKLIEKIKHGDETAMDIVINQYARLLWTIADAVLEKVGTIQDVEECVADVFIYLWQHAEKYAHEKGKLKVWLSIITRTRAINRYRKLCQSQALPLQEEIFLQRLDLTEHLESQEKKTLLLSAINLLKEEERDILTRRYYYEQKPKTIATALGLSVKRVENILYRAKQKLRQILADQKEVLL